MTMECSCRLCPSPGMYAVTSKPFVSRTRATLRKAEFGFFGVVVYTRVHTPRFCGDAASAGTLDFQAGSFRPVRINWVVVAINTFRAAQERIAARCINLKLTGMYAPHL